jgi:dTDP-4-amino-4,6-dideoxygalactose transaminase
MKALNIGPGDEVITCPNSFIASAWTIIATGAKPVFVDVGEDFNMDPLAIRSKISRNTKAILPIHLTGRIADMHSINLIAKEYGLFVIEDAAQAFGARYHNKRAGSLGDIAGFSLHPLKNLGVYGDGGLITTNNAKLHHKILKLRNHGLINRDECEIWGFNSRLDTMQAAFGLIKLNHIDDWNKRCRHIANLYRKHLSDFVITPQDRDNEEPVYHNFVIRTEFRDELMLFLAEKGIGTRIHYPIPIHLQQAAKDLGYALGDFPTTESYMHSMMSLPIFPELTDSEIQYVIETIQLFFKK